MSHPSYAHLLQSVRGANAAKDVTDENEDHEAEHTPPAEDKEDGKKAKKKAKGKKASDEGDEDEKREDKDSDEGEESEEKEDKKEEKERKREDKEDKKGKKASASLSDLDAEAVRLEERVRCATIFRSKAASGRPDLAARFAFHTDMSAETAISIMETVAESPAPRTSARVGIDQRMQNAPRSDVGVEAPEGAAPQQGYTEAQLAAMKPEARALAIVNAGRSLRNEEKLKALPAA